MRDVEGATVLILGHGSIGAAVERLLEPFGAEVLRVARSARDGVHGLGDLDELLPRADVVVVLLPLTEQTRGLVDARRARRSCATAPSWSTRAAVRSSTPTRWWPRCRRAACARCST